MNLLGNLLTVGMAVVADPDNPTGGDPDAVIIEGERLDPEDVSVDDDGTDDDEGYDDADLDDDDDGTLGDDPDIDTQDPGNFRQRHGDAVRWGQQQKARADAFEKRFNDLKAEGVDIEEIEKLLPKRDPAPMPSLEAQNFASKQDLNRFAQNIQWSLARSAFLTSNPEFKKNKELGAMLEFQASKVIQNNVQKMGALTLGPDKVYRSAAKAVNEMVKALESKGKKKANQTRKKVKSQSADLGGDTGKRAGKTNNKDDDLDNFDPRASYMNIYNR